MDTGTAIVVGIVVVAAAGVAIYLVNKPPTVVQIGGSNGGAYGDKGANGTTAPVNDKGQQSVNNNSDFLFSAGGRIIERGASALFSYIMTPSDKGKATVNNASDSKTTIATTTRTDENGLQWTRGV
jgi:hypothetical protein